MVNQMIRVNLCANVRVKTHSSKFSFHILFARTGCLEELSYALAHGIDIDDKDDVLKRIDIHDAALNGKMDVAIALLDQGATVVDRDYNGSTTLYLTAITGNTTVVTLLLERGAKINKKNITLRLVVDIKRRSLYFGLQVYD